MSTTSESRPEAEQGYYTAKVVLLASVAALGGFLFGFDPAVINGAVGPLQNDFGIGDGLTGFVVSSALLGAMAGAYFAGALADRFGRIRVMYLASAMFTVSAVGSFAAVGPWDMILWRVIGGMGVGAASVIAPAYIAEISPAVIRGRMGSLQQLAIVSGIFVALLSNYFLSQAAGGSGEPLFFDVSAWRWMFLAELIPAVLYGVLAVTIPESPRYLVSNGDEKTAREILSRVLKGGIDHRISEIRRTIVREQKASLSDIRGKAAGLKPIVWIGIGLAFFQQFVGINVIFYYSTVLWQSVGFTEADALKQTVITSVTNIVVTVVAIALIDKIGRRLLLLIGSAGMLVTLGTLAYVFANATVKMVDGEEMPILGDTAGLVALIAANGFVVFFGMSWGPAMWVLLGEMFSNKIRGTALGVAAAANWLSNFAISTAFPAAAAYSLGVSYGFFALMALLSFLFVLKFVPETNNVELEDMV